MEQQLNNLYKHVLDSLYDGVYLVDRNRKILYWNEGAVRLTGYKVEEVVGRFCPDNILDHIDEKGEHLCLNGCPLQATMGDGRFRESVVYLRQKNGSRRCVKVKISPMRNKDNEIIGAIEIFSDNSHELAVLERLNKLEDEAYLDHLTGVCNRRSLEDQIETRLAELRDREWSFALCFIDIDDFKRFNDTHGHDVGDRILKMVASGLSTSIRSFDIAGRWGGEEFVTILGESSLGQAQEVANRHRALIADSHCLHNDKRLSVTVSIGLTMATAEDTLESLIARADSLMYESKKRGKNTVTSG